MTSSVSIKDSKNIVVAFLAHLPAQRRTAAQNSQAFVNRVVPNPPPIKFTPFHTNKKTPTKKKKTSNRERDLSVT